MEKGNKNSIDVLYATNQSYLIVTLASILSLIENSNLLDKTLNLHLITEGLMKDDFSFLESFFHQYKNVDLAIYPIEEFNIDKYHIPDWQHTQVANARLFFQDILGNKIKDIKQLLYLDSDTIVVDDLTGLFQYQDGIYAVRDNCMPAYYHKLNLDKYYNSGVLFLDTSTWINEGYQEQIVEFIEKNNSIDLLYPDQDILNCALKEKIKQLPVSYNLSPYMCLIKNFTLQYYCSKTDNDYQKIKENINNPKILHSCGILGIKPWSDNKVNPYNDIFRNYIERIDASFELHKLGTIKGFLANHPYLFKTFLNFRTYTPEYFENASKKVLSKIYQSRKM